MLIVGQSNVGKTSIAFKYVDGIFDDNMLATIGIDFKVKTMEVNNKKYKIQIWDTAGQERFRTVTSTLYRGVHGILICFDLTNRETLDDVASRWLVEMQSNGIAKCPMVLVGNKCDLVNEIEVTQDDVRRFVTSNAQILDSLCAAFPYFEVSAKTGKNIDVAFTRLIDLVIENSGSETSGQQ